MSIKEDIDSFLKQFGKTEKVKVDHSTPVEEGHGVFSLSEAWFQEIPKYTKNKILSEHMKCHELFQKAKEGSTLMQYVKKSHVALIKEMRRSGIKHYVRSDFDKECEVLVKSNSQGNRVYLKELLNKFKSFTLKDVKVWLVGDAATKCYTDKDIHLLIGLEKKHKEVEHKLLGLFPSHLRDRVKFLYVPEGPSDGCVPLYVIKYQLPNSNIINSITEVSHFNFIRPLNAVKEKVVKDAKSLSDNNIAFPVEISVLEDNNERVQVHSKEGTIKIFDDAGQDITDKDGIALFKNVSGAYVFDMYKNKDSYILFDIIEYNNNALHTKPLKSRRDVMEKVKLPSGIILNKVLFAHDKVILEKAIDTNFADAKGILLRPLDDIYDLKGVSNSWIKFTLEGDANE